MFPSYDQAHVAEALARIINQYQANTQLVAIIQALAAQAQKIEDALQTFSNLLSIANSSGAQLDGIGQLLDQDRQGMADAQYRTWLTAKALAISSDGSTERLIAIAKLLLPSSTIHLQDTGIQQGLILIVPELTAPDGGDVAKILQLARAGGNRIIFEWHKAEPAFAFASGSPPVSVAGFATQLMGWQQNNPTGFSDTAVVKMAILNGVTLAIGEAGDLAISQDDGFTWSVIHSVFPSNTTVGRGGLAYGNGIYVAVSDATFTWSTDLVTWTSVNGHFSGQHCWSVRYLGGFFIAVGSNATISTSTDGKTWTQFSAGASGDVYLDVAYGVPFSLSSAIWVAIGQSGNVSVTTDTLTWNESNITSDTLFQIQFAAVSSSGSFWISSSSNPSQGGVWYTPDGSTWNSQSISGTPPSFFQWNIRDNKFIWCDTGHEVWTSTDGLAWTFKFNASAKVTAGDNLFSTDGRVWMLGCSDGHTYESSNFGSTFTQITPALSAAIDWISAGAVGFVAADHSCNLYHTTQAGGHLASGIG